MGAPGKLIGIARRSGVRLPMEELPSGAITVDRGLDGDHKGPKFPRRRITVLAREAWDEALAELSRREETEVRLPWTVRRANLLFEGVRLPRARGGIIQIGPVRLEITNETNPCGRMDEAFPGLLKALHPEWRGGVTCKVLEGGIVTLGDEVELVVAPLERVMRLP
jgi:MOSC domain-containing protein YiiM